MVRNLTLIVGLSLAMAAFGCSSDGGGSGGSAGAGGTAGSGGTAGDGGNGGGAGGGGDAMAPACDNATDMAAGDPDVTTCATAAATTNNEYCPAPGVGTGEDSSGLATCLAADGGAENTAACLDCWADFSCCTLNVCSVLVGGPCAGAPEPGDACDQCVQQNCVPAFEACGEAG